MGKNSIDVFKEDLVVVKTLDEMKNAVSLDRGIIIVDDRFGTNECVSYFNKHNVVKIAGTAGVVLGIFVSWPLLILGIGQKIAGIPQIQKIKNYGYSVSNDMNRCILINKDYAELMWNSTIESFKRYMNEYDLDIKTMAEGAGLKGSNVKSALSGKPTQKNYGFCVKMSVFLDKIAQKNLDYPMNFFDRCCEEYGFSPNYKLNRI